MVIEIDYELNLNSEKAKQFEGKWLVVQNISSFDIVPTVKYTKDDYYETTEKQCVESFDFIVAVCDTEIESLDYLKKCKNVYKEWTTYTYYTFLFIDEGA